MFKQIDFTTNSGIEYIMFYDSDKMTEEQALLECEFVERSRGYNHELFPYYLIIDRKKQPIFRCIRTSLQGGLKSITFEDMK